MTDFFIKKISTTTYRKNKGAVMQLKAEIIDAGNLSHREAQVAELMAEGYADKCIARLLNLSFRTVQAHSNSIYKKLDLHKESISINTTAINHRCYAVALMIARGMMNVSLKSMVAVLIFGAVHLDDSSLRARNVRARVRVQMVQARRCANA